MSGEQFATHFLSLLDICCRAAWEQSQRLNIAQINTFLETIMHTENCLDRHAEEDPNRVALIWEKDEPNQQEKVTYRYSASTIKHINKLHFAIKWGNSLVKVVTSNDITRS